MLVYIIYIQLYDIYIQYHTVMNISQPCFSGVVYRFLWRGTTWSCCGCISQSPPGRIEGARILQSKWAWLKAYALWSSNKSDGTSPS